jgi:hypothetical protein
MIHFRGFVGCASLLQMTRNDTFSRIRGLCIFITDATCERIVGFHHRNDGVLKKSEDGFKKVRRWF